MTGRSELGVPVRRRQPIGQSSQLHDQGEARVGDERQPDDAEAAHFQQPGQRRAGRAMPSAMST